MPETSLQRRVGVRFRRAPHAIPVRSLAFVPQAIRNYSE